MARNITYLHSHSAIERTLKDKDIANKSHVLVDESFKSLFADGKIKIKPFVYNSVKYIKVPILAFVKRGGIFKNFDS